jgi:uncharacterized repeat protein (TIGR01451 family)
LTVLAVAGALFLATGSRTTFTQSGPVPQVTLNVPAEVLIGEDFTFTVKFKNASANPGDIGYGPFIDLVLDAGGANLSKNNPACACDGITFVKAEMVGVVGGPIMLTPSLPSPINTTPCGTVSNTSVSHPLASSGILPLTVPPGGQLITLELPFGSFDPTQPEIVVEVTAHVSNLADAGTPLKIFARGGFRYGTDPLDNPSTDPPIVSDLTSSGGQETNSTLWAAQATVTPTVITVGKKYLGPEDEAATGPNFTSVYPLQYAITVDIANGQTVSNVTVTDCFPNNLAFQSVVSVSPTTPPPTVTPPPPGPNNPPNNCLTVTWPSLTGASGPDATVVVDFFIPEKDANGNPVLPPNCQPVQSVNDVKAEGDWMPIDPCDTSPAHVVSDVTTSDHILADKCIAIQKKVAVFQDTGAPGPTPGDVLQYTLNFQISDFKTFGKLEIRDQLSDGQQFLPAPAPTLTVTDQFGTVSGPFIPFLDLFVTGDPNSICQGIKGTTNLVFMVSQKMTSLFPSNPRHAAGILTGGGATTPTSSVPATGQIVFYARIQDQFSFPQNHPGDRFVDKDDPLANCVTIRGEVFTNVNPPTIPSPTGVVVTDDSKTITSIVTDVIKKTVYAVKRGGQEICGPNTSPCPAKPQVTPGDQVTFRIEKTIPSSDAENLTIQDWLPLPIFDVADPDANGTAGPPMSFSAAACGIPAPGQACLGPTNTLTVSPTFTSNVPTNSVTFNYGTFNDPTNTPRKIDLLFTLTATNDPFADGLFLTNEARECETNTFGTTFCQVAIAQVQMAEPDVRIMKGVVATDNPNGVFSPTPVGPVTFNSPGSSCATRFNGIINSNGLATNPINSNISNVDANDTVTFAIVVENLGTGPNGAFDVKIRDIFPFGLGGLDLPSCFAPDPNSLCVAYGDGTVIPSTGYILTTGPFGTFTIELIDPSLTQGALGPFSPTSGKNIVVITFDAKIIPNIKPGCCDNRAKLENYSNTEGGPNFVTAGFGGPFEDTAEVCVKPKATKSIKTTSEAHTPGTPSGPPQSPEQLAIGEIVRYRLEILVPETTSPSSYNLQDFLPAGLQFLNDGTAKVAFVCNQGCITSSTLGAGPTISGNQMNLGTITPTFTLPPTAITPNIFACGTDPIFNLGNLTNNDNDTDQEFIVLEFNALVCNIPSNHNGTPLNNSFGVFVDGQQVATSNIVQAVVVEPNLTITKTVSPNSVVPGGGPVTYTVTIANTGTADAFDIVFTDTLPPGLTLNLGSVTAPGPCTNNSSGNTVNVTCPQLDDGTAIQITYQATVSATAPCPTTLTNTATVTWTSLPGPKGTCPNPTGSCTPGNSGAIDGERDGSTAPNPPNKYAAAASATLTVTCPPGTIVIKKASVGGDDTFPFTASAGLPGSFTITTTSGSGTQTFSNLTTPGTYTVTELAPPAGWTFTSLTCTDPTNNTTVSSSTATIVLDPGETVTCTYTNTKSTACVDPSSLPNMVAWWPMDGNPLDLWASHNPSATNAITFVPGMVGQGVTFGTGGYIDIPHSPALANQQFTIDAWVKPQGPGPNNDFWGSVIVQKGRSAPTGYTDVPIALWWSAQQQKFIFGFGNHNTERIVSTSTFPAGQWYHVAATYDGQTFKLYVNGMLEGTMVLVKTIVYDPAIPWTIGSTASHIRTVGYPRTFNGVIDEVELFKRALTQQEIQAIYNAGSAGKCKCATVSNGQIACNPNGTFSYTATLTNVTNAVVTGINLVPPAGVTITPSSITTPLSPGQSVTGTVTTGGPNAQPGSTVCVDIVLTTQGVVTCQTKHCVTLPTCPGPGPCAQAPPGMVSWWPLDDAVGQSTVQDLVGGNNGTTKDSTGTPLNISLGAGPPVVSQLPAPNILGGTLTPVVVDPSTSPLRGALFFNGSFTEVPHNPNLNIGPNGITITFWAFASPIPIARTPLLEKFDVSSTNGYSLYLEVNSPTTYALKMNLNGTILTGPSVPQGLSPSDWRFIAARVSATGTVTLAVCDLGGSCSTTTATVSSFVTTNTSPLWFGRSAVAYPGAVVAAYEQALDEIEIFNRALTQAELQSIYDAERQGRRKCPCVPLPPDMVAWYPLDEQNGATTVSDIASPPASTVSDTGTPKPGPVGSGGPNPVPGKVGAGALYFFGPFVEVPPSADLIFTGDFSIDAWIRVVECGMSGGGVLAPIVDKWDPTTQTGFSLFVDQPSPSTGFLKLQLNNMLFTSTGSLPTGANPLANTGPWVHVAVTVNRTTGVGTFYINGAPAGTFTVPAGSITNALTMLIGEIRVPGGRCELAIDELELFKRVLTPKEVQDLFNADSAGKCRPQPGQTGQICVTKFEDLDGDGVQDPNEPLLPNWVFNVTDPSNNPVGTITTTPPGTPPACLTVAAPATLTVTEQVQSGWTPTTPNPQTVTVQPGQTVNVTFGNQGKAEICIFKFSDLDGDGKQGPNEPPLAGWQFTVSPAPLPPTTSPVTTGPQGSICFGVAAPGTYTITEQVQSGWTVTTPNPQTVTVTPGQLVNVFFGNRPQPGEICVVKFEDLDGDGVRDTNEPLLAGWQFTVTDASNTPVGTITTGQTQPTCLKSVAPGTYTVTETVQSGWTVTTPNPQTVTVAPATSSVVEFGNKRVTYQICGIKWNDLDGDGVKDPNEPGLPGWTINMVFQTPGGPLDVQTTTDANGQYCFTGLAPGTYTISETLQPGWIQTFPPSPGTYTVTVPPSAMNINFGNKQGVCDREITKTITPNPAQSGQQVTITLTVTNVGTAACPAVPGVVLADPQPTGMTFQPPVSVTGSGAAGWNCFISSPSGAWPGGVQCTATNPLPPGTGVTITFAATVTGTPGSQIQNCAEVTNVGDANQANNKSCVTLQVTGCVTPPANMTAWWPLDETSGTTAADIAGFPNNGTHVNGPTPTPGKVGGALRFDGVDDHVSVLDHAELDVGTGNFTLDAWVRTQASSGVVVLVDKRSGPTPLGYSLFLANGRLGFQMANGVGSSICAPTPTPGVACVNYVATAPNVADGQWHHVAAVVDRADATSGVRLYVDGVQVFAGSPLTGNLDNTSDLYLGMRTPAQNGGGFLRGDLDEVELIKRALTQQEIQAIFNAGSAGKCKGCIEGMKWNDANGNGVINPGEAGLSGWTIQLTGPVNQTTTTGAGGTYRFCGLPPGTYTVAEVLQPLWVQTFPPTPGTHTVTLAANQVVTGRNFGNRRVIIFPDFTPTNLVVIPPGIPGGNVALGSQVLVRFDIVNQGTGEAGPARHEIRLFIPEGAGHGQIDRLLATVMTGPLAAGASQSFNQLVTIPRDVPTGPALIRVIADAPNGISESEEGNNVAEFRIVLIRPGP